MDCDGAADGPAAHNASTKRFAGKQQRGIGARWESCASVPTSPYGRWRCPTWAPPRGGAEGQEFSLGLGGAMGMLRAHHGRRSGRWVGDGGRAVEYSESLDKAGEYARSAFSLMESTAIPATANTFAVWFVYYPGRRPDLSRVPLTVGP